MSCARVTLLSIIKKRNQAKDLYESKSQQMESTLTLVDKDDMAKITAFEMIEAAKVIWIAAKRWLLKKWRKSWYYITDIYFDADHDITDRIYIVGDFTSPKWSIQIPMKYSFFHRSFLIRVKIHDNSQFKFIVDGTYICWPTYPMVYSPDKFTNNVFKTCKIRHYSESRSFRVNKDEVQNILNWGEELYQHKNSHIMNLIDQKNKIDSNHLYKSQSKYSYFSPDVNFGEKELNHFKYITPFWDFQSQFRNQNMIKKN